MLFGPWIFQLGDDLRNDVVCLSEVPKGAEREQRSRIQDEVFASRLRARHCHPISKVAGRYSDIL